MTNTDHPRRNDTTTTPQRRAHLMYDAVVAGYINDISDRRRPPRRREAVELPLRVRRVPAEEPLAA